jgi:methionine-rich copper-binding protein CopC
VRIFVCGAVKDILMEFSKKIERHGVEVIATEEWSPKGGYAIPQAAEAVVIGIDQASHTMVQAIVGLCKSRNLPYAMGELRKWSLLYPRLVAAGIIVEGVVATPTPEEEAAMASAPVKLVKEDGPETVKEEAMVMATVVKSLLDSLTAMNKEGMSIELKLEETAGSAHLEWAGGKVDIHYSEGKAYVEAEYVAKLKMEL